jgi:hypothetical protein
MLDVLQARGLSHEQARLEYLRTEQGLDVLELESLDCPSVKGIVSEVVSLLLRELGDVIDSGAVATGALPR